MGDMGLQGAYGNDALYQLLAQRTAEKLAAQQYADKQTQQQFENNFKNRQLDETTALRKSQEADRMQTAAETAAERRASFARLDLPNVPRSRDLSVDEVRPFFQAGLGSSFQETPTTVPAPPPAIQAPDDPGGPSALQGSIRSAPAPGLRTFNRQPTQAEVDREAADAERKSNNAATQAGRAGQLDARQQQIDQSGQLLGVRGALLEAQTQAALARIDAQRAKDARRPKLPQREDDTVVSIHQMMPLVNELLSKTQARLANQPKPTPGIMGYLGALPEKVGRLMTKAAYTAGLPVAPADSERVQLASLLQILGTVPYLRGIRNMQFVQQIQQHLADPSATDASLVERLSKLKEILPGMEQAIYDVHNGGVIPHAHTGAMAPSTGPKRVIYDANGNPVQGQ